MALPPHTCNLTDGETFPVKVFRDSPLWDRVEKWWMMRQRDLDALYVATYECDCQRHLDWLEKEHPGHVFVYCCNPATR